jgi:hypothetical protein
MQKTAIRTIDGASRWLPSRTGRALYAPARAHADRSESDGRRLRMRGRRAPGMAGRQPQLDAGPEDRPVRVERVDVGRPLPGVVVIAAHDATAVEQRDREVAARPSTARGRWRRSHRAPYARRKRRTPQTGSTARP